MEHSHFFDKESNTFTYVLYDKVSKDAAVIDPVFQTIEIQTFIDSNDLKLKYILETHIHADHISGASNLKKIYPNSRIGIHENIELVHENFREVLNLSSYTDTSNGFDLLLSDADELELGSATIKVISTPGHTPACVSFYVDGKIFTGDTLFMPDFGSGRCDFPGGSSRTLYQSIHQKLFSLPGDTKVFVGHDYGTEEREVHNETTIEESRKNYQLGVGIDEEKYVTFRDNRDAGLSEPKNLLVNIEANLFAGRVRD